MGLTQYAVAGHDWGGAVAFALAADHPDAVTHLAVVDVAIPGDGQPNIGQAGRRWHHTFLQTLDLPEALIGGREHLFFDWFFTNYGHFPDAISPKARAEYLRTHTTPGALRAGFAYHRAIAQDVADNQARTDKVAMPTLAIGGGTSWAAAPRSPAPCARWPTTSPRRSTPSAATGCRKRKPLSSPPPCAPSSADTPRALSDHQHPDG